MKKFLLSLATAFSFVLFLGSCTNEEDINNNGYSDKEKREYSKNLNIRVIFVISVLFSGFRFIF